MSVVVKQQRRSRLSRGQQAMATAPLLILIFATWLVICPEVLLINALLSLISSEWNVYLRTAVLTAIAIPPAMLWFVPALSKAYLKIRATAHLRSKPAHGPRRTVKHDVALPTPAGDAASTPQRRENPMEQVNARLEGGPFDGAVRDVTGLSLQIEVSDEEGRSATYFETDRRAPGGLPIWTVEVE
jgi:hypothetical protein